MDGTNYLGDLYTIDRLAMEAVIKTTKGIS